LLDDEGLIQGNCQGKIVIDITTNHPVKVLEFYKILGERGGIYLEAPVLGSVIPASQGLLTVLVSGDRKALERIYIIFRNSPGRKRNPLFIGSLAKELFAHANA